MEIPAKMLRSPLRWVGGKSRLRETLLARMPAHDTYVELFSGAAWLLFGKDPAASKCEVLNDLDGELINFWRVVKHRSAEFCEAAAWQLASREWFEEWKRLPAQGSEVERAVRFYSIIRLAYGAKRTTNHFALQIPKQPPLHWPLVREEVGKVVARLRSVWITNWSWDVCVAKTDGPRTFFYVDPPYYACKGAEHYAHRFKQEDHEALAAGLLRVRGKWLLSYNDDARVRRLYRHRGVRIERVWTRYGLQGGLWKQARELLIRNF